MAGQAVVDAGTLTKLLRGPGGPVGSFLVRKGAQAEAAMKTLCPVGKGVGGHTRDTVKADRVPHQTADGLGLYVRAGKAAIFLVKGTRPHPIEPRSKTILRFEVGGQVVWAKHVNHPGTKVQNFMMEGARSVF